MVKAGTKILLIEDDDDLREALEGLLSEAGFVVIAAVDGPAGVAKSRNQKFEIIICDIGMPRMRGDMAIGAIRQAGENKNTPIVVISGVLDTEVLNNIRGKVSRAFVKPFQVNELVEYLTKYCEGNEKT